LLAPVVKVTESWVYVVFVVVLETFVPPKFLAPIDTVFDALPDLTQASVFIIIHAPFL